MEPKACTLHTRLTPVLVLGPWRQRRFWHSVLFPHGHAALLALVALLAQLRQGFLGHLCIFLPNFWLCLFLPRSLILDFCLRILAAARSQTFEEPMNRTEYMLPFNTTSWTFQGISSSGTVSRGSAGAGASGSSGHSLP